MELYFKFYFLTKTFKIKENYMRERAQKSKRLGKNKEEKTLKTQLPSWLRGRAKRQLYLTEREERVIALPVAPITTGLSHHSSIK